MKRFNQYKKNKLTIKLIKKMIKKFNPSNFKTMNGYLVSTNISKKSILHFDLPNNYKIGIWLDTNQIFAEHLYVIDKFKPSYVEFSNTYNSIWDIVLFIEKVAKIKHIEYNTLLNNSNKNIAELNRNIYQYLIKQENVLGFELKRDLNSYTYNKEYSLNVLLDSTKEDIENKIELFEENLENIYNYYKEMFDDIELENNIFYWILTNKLENIQYFY